MPNVIIRRENFTPTKVKALFASTKKAGFHNRNICRSNVNRYAGDMQRGKWFDDTAELIRISSVEKLDPETGEMETLDVLIDGQHRLCAVAAIGKPRKFYVARNVPMKAFQFLDQGKPRDLQDLMLTEGGWGTMTRDIANAGRMLWKHSTTGDPRVRPSGMESESNGAILDYLNTNHRPDLLDLYEKIKTRLNRTARGERHVVQGMGPQSLHLYIQYMWRQEDEARADQILTYLEDPRGASVKPPSVLWYCASLAIHLIREDSTAGAGTVKKGRHVDFVNGAVTVLWAAWQMEKKRIHTTARTEAQYNKIFNAYVHGQNTKKGKPITLEEDKLFPTL